MNAENEMRKIAEIQCNLAVVSILLFIALSGWFVISLLWIQSIVSLLLILPFVASWWLGIRLLSGYENISRGRVNIAETRNFWCGSLAFNAIGLSPWLYAVYVITKGFVFGENWILEGEPWTVVGVLAFVFVALSPTFRGCVFAIRALKIQKILSQSLEPQIP